MTSCRTDLRGSGEAGENEYVVRTCLQLAKQTTVIYFQQLSSATYSISYSYLIF